MTQTLISPVSLIPNPIFATIKQENFPEFPAVLYITELQMVISKALAKRRLFTVDWQ
jgi:hypothetical protein